MRRLLLVGVSALLVSGTYASAHELNPKVIKWVTGEQIEYDHASEQVALVEADPREETRTYYSFPEWYIVYSAQEYASFVQAGNRPSQFPFFASIGQMWTSWRQAAEAAQVPPDATTNTVLWTIALSYTAEYGLVGLYENTFGRISEWHFWYAKTAEDVYIDAQAAAYGEFLNQTPWYQFLYVSALAGLWQTYGMSSFSVRGLERRMAFTVGYGVKALYAAAIAALSAANFEGGAGQFTRVTVEADRSLLEAAGVPFVTATATDAFVVTLPRYRALRDPLIHLARIGATFVTIEDNDTIALSLVTPSNSDCVAVTNREAFALPLVTDDGLVRRVVRVEVPELAAFIGDLDACGLTIEHVYDY